MTEPIIVYTDGGSRGNGEANCVAAWAYTLTYRNHYKEDSAACYGATNNQMEMTAIIKALEAIKNKSLPIRLYSDSAYCINGITTWIKGWKQKGWVNASKKPVENKALWIQMDNLVTQCQDIQFIKVKGHADVKGNIKVDALVNQAMDNVKYKEKQS